ncbi:hypothetical protein [Enterococcus sp. AZ109]|uniref:hypothetical protein n=1 Tax=Enterococcus sp. AZ109 TaxID=2774634 RepID=UPI003F211934
MTRNKTILAMLVLVLITASSYTLAKITEQQTYVISVNDAKYDKMEPPEKPSQPSGEEALIEEEPEVQQETAVEEIVGAPSEEITDDLAVGATVPLTPQVVFEAESPVNEPQELFLPDEGIYAIQLYGEAADEAAAGYLVGYLTYTTDQVLTYQLGAVSEDLLEEPADQSGKELDLPKISQLFVADSDEPIMQVGPTDALMDETILTAIAADSQLHEQLSPKEERTTGKMLVTYLGPISEAAQMETLNQTH